MNEVVYCNDKGEKQRISTTDNPVLAAFTDSAAYGVPELVKLQQGTILRGAMLDQVLDAMRRIVPGDAA